MAVEDGSEAAAVLLGMAGFEVLVADEAPDGQVWLLVHHRPGTVVLVVWATSRVQGPQ